MFHISIDNCSCAAPGGPVLFSGLSTAISHELVGLVGRNGCGKSTLIEVVAGLRQPLAGSVSCTGKIGLMAQLPPSGDTSVAQALGIGHQLRLQARIEAGEARENDLENADWTVQDRLDRALASFGLVGIDLGRRIGSLSGGERTRLRLASTLLDEPDILLLDEPTNDLDAAGRMLVARALADWQGPALVASHDRALLENVDRIIELSPAGIMSVGGGWSEFVERRDAERMRAIDEFEAARSELKSAQRRQQDRTERQARRAKQGKKSAQRRDDTKLEINARKRQADKTNARSINIGESQIDDAQERLDTAREGVERLVPVRIVLPKSGTSPSKVLLDGRGIICAYEKRTLFGPLDLTIRGADRIALIGANGSGKTSLIQIIAGLAEPEAGSIEAEREHFAILDQHLSLLRAEETALEAMRRHNPSLDRNGAYAALAAFGFRNQWGQRICSSLSGGERVRLALACLFSRRIPPRLLILDEPTNHLDIAATELLEQALKDYDGAILCVSHDQAFRSNVGLTRELRLGEG